MIDYRGKLPFVKLSGDPAEIGLQHGRLLAERVHKCWDYYANSLFGEHDLDLAHWGEQYLEAVHAFRRAYAEEMTAIAAGAGLAPWQIGVINARSEIYHRILSENLAPECTALFFREPRILGQNWDWMAECEDFMTVLEVTRPDGHRFLTLTEAGIIGKIGMSDKGIGACLNILSGHVHQLGVPVHVFLRFLLDADDLPAAVETIRQAPSGSYSNIFAADGAGRIANIEFAGPKLAVLDFSDRFPLHTNHYLSEDRDDKSHPIYLSSATRYARALELAQSAKDQSAENMKRLLLDDKNDENALCADYAAYYNFRIGTVSTVIMDLPQRRMQVAEGHPKRSPFHEFRL